MAEINSGRSSSRRKVSDVNMLNYLIKRSTDCRESDSKQFTKYLWDTAKDLYKKDLTAHYGCVNAIEFSNDGNLLFSGGDDRRVLMWNVNSAMMYYTGKMGEGSKPKVMRACHFSNIFCLAVDDENKRILSGSNDDQVIVHDYTTGNPVAYFLHDSPVFSLSLHPMNGNIFASAADNGRILINDIRESNSEPLCLAKFRTPFHGVMFSPVAPCLIATANARVGIHIWDMRKPREVLHECSDEQSMAVRWNQSGTILLALRNLLPPIIYNPRYPKRKLEFDSDGYYNACTMKSCSFAGNNDEYILSGSDDFNLYMWKIPDPWPESRWIPNAHLTLTGHRSIVNQVRYDPNKQLIASSGVEKIIKIWSPIRMPYSEGDRDKPCTERSRVLCSSRACSRGHGLLNHDYSQESVDEDTRMIHFFDSLLRNELDAITPSSISPFCCVDGKLFPFSKRRKEVKSYEQLIFKKKKHLSKILMGKHDPPVCSLSQGGSGNRGRSGEDGARAKKYHFSLEENQLLTASEEDDGHAETDQQEQQQLPGNDRASSNDDTSIIDRSSSSQSSTSNSPSSSSSSSSSSALSNSRFQSIFDSSYGSESALSTAHSDESYDWGLFRRSVTAPKKIYLFSESESDEEEDEEEDEDDDNGEEDDGGGGENRGSNTKKKSSKRLKASGSGESADGVGASSSFKRKRFSEKNRCYRRPTGRRKASSSEEESETPSKKRKDSEEEVTTTGKCGESQCLNGATSEQKRAAGEKSVGQSMTKDSSESSSNRDDNKS